MQAGSLNAAMLLAKVLEGERGKIGNGIAKSDFAGELKKLLPKKNAKTGTTGTSESATVQTGSGEVPEALKAVGAEQTQTSTQAAESTGKYRTARSSTDAAAKIKTLNNRAKNSKTLYITDPVLVESTLAKLHYPPDTIKAAESMRARDGSISLKDFANLLQKKADTTAATAASAQGTAAAAEKVLIPAAAARAVIAAIAAKTSGSGHGSTQSSSKTLKSSIAKQVPAGKEYYTVEEFQGLLENILEKASGTTTETAATVQKQGAVTTRKLNDSTSEKEEPRISGQVDVAPKQGQTESIAATVLPSFISDKPGDREQGKARAGTAAARPAGPEKTGADTRRDIQTPVSSDGAETAEKTPAGSSGAQTASGAEAAQAELAENLPANSGRTGERDRFHPDAADRRGAPDRQPQTAEGKTGTGEAKNIASSAVSDTIVSADGSSTRTESPASEELAREAARSFEQLRVSQVSVSRPAAQEKPVLHGQDVAAVAKEMGKNLKVSEPASDAAALHAGSAHFQGDRIEMSQMQQTPGDGLSYYDPSRSAEIAQFYREHAAGAGGHQLVLEVEPSEFGKMSIKIDAKKDDVSAVVLTENEPARHALLRNSPELRQNFQDQGLNLGRFEVNVNRENTGGNNSPEPQKQQTPGTPNARKTSAPAAAVRTAPVYARTGGTLSQVSIFA